MARTKTDIKYTFSLDEGQKEVKRDIYDNQIVVFVEGF